MRNRNIAIGVLAVVVVFLIFGATAPVVPVKYKTTEPHQITKTYQTTEPYKKEVPYKYEVTNYVYEGVGITNWELKQYVTVKNLKNEGGAFKVTLKYYDGDNLMPKQTESQKKYIAPGEKATFTDTSNGLSWSTDWESRYDISYEVSPPTKTVIKEKVVTKHKTVTKQKVVTKEKLVTLFEYFSGEYKST